MSLDTYDIPLSDMEKVLAKWATEAVEMRHGEAGDPDGKLSTGSDESPMEALQFLRRVRQRADRVDELLQAAKRARGRVRRALAEASFQADNAMDTEIQKQAVKRVEFSAASERKVEAKLATFEKRREEHLARRLVDVAEESVDVINQMHWSLDAIRKDLRGTLHALQFESSLER